jgi:hypothetical protein
MNRLLNAEEVLDLMLNHVSLSRYDQKFFYNLQVTNVLSRKPITSNQVALFKKVVKKYKTQLGKQQFDSEQLSELPWTLTVIQSSPEYTQAQFSIENGELILKCPYKASFVQEFRDHSIMTWNREKRFYNTEFGLYKLKLAIGCVMKHYDTVMFCDTIRNIIDEISIHDENSCWDPTLVRCNDRLYIFNLNEPLARVIKDIELNTDLSTISLLVSYGIKISEHVINKLKNEYTLDEIKFAIHRNAIHELSDVEGLADKLKKIKCDYVIYAAVLHSSLDALNYDQQLKKHLNFPIDKVNNRNTDKFVEPNKYNMPVMIRSSSSYSAFMSGTFYASKVITLVNSSPIELK